MQIYLLFFLLCIEILSIHNRVLCTKVANGRLVVYRFCLGLSFEAEGTHGVEYSQYGDAHVCKDCHPHAGPSDGC